MQNQTNGRQQPLERQQLLDADAVADWLAVDRLRVYELACTGAIPAVRLGRTVRFDPATMHDWIAGGGTASREAEVDG